MDLEKLFSAAVGEMKNEQYEEAAKHFDMIVVESGEHAEAQFYRAYCKCHVGRLGDIPSQAQIFTNAFCKYVDQLAELDDVELKEKKLADAIEKMSELTSYYSSNGSRTLITAPTIGFSINNAAKKMSATCTEKVKASGIKVNSATIEKASKASSENNKMRKILIGVIAVGALAWIIYEVVTWIQIGSL